MRFLADENVPRSIVWWLRSQSHDVLAAAEARAQTSDADLLSEAEAQCRPVLKYVPDGSWIDHKYSFYM